MCVKNYEHSDTQKLKCYVRHISGSNKFWEEPIAYFRLVRHRLHRK
jgi:hypothetical protein